MPPTPLFDPARWSAMCPLGRRRFLRSGLLVAAGLPWLRSVGEDEGEEAVVAATRKAPAPPVFSPSVRANARVAVVRCREFGPAVHRAMADAFDRLGGVGRLVKGRTVTVKLNLTGSNFEPLFGRPVGDSYMTHPDSASALASLLFRAGATRVRFVESTQRIQRLEETVAEAGWDLKALESLGRVEWENTRNLGRGKTYATLKVGSGGHLFSELHVNRSYEETDVVVSLCKLKNHLTCGVTLALKNMFGIVPNSLYGDEAPNERATAGRGPLHNRRAYRGRGRMPGEREVDLVDSAFLRVPRIVTDIAEARPIDLSVIDGIVSMKGGEGPWAGKVVLTTPGVLVVGLNPVSADAVGTALMGYRDPRAIRGTEPFLHCDNHLLLAEQRGVGVLELGSIEMLGLPLAEAIHAYGPMG